jgi:serralysin
VTFTEITETASQHADLRFAQSNAPSTAWAYFPSSASYGGDSWYNYSSGYYANPVVGNYAWTTFLHEIGHALGLEHGHQGGDYGPMTSAHDSMEYSVMTYRSYEGASTTSGYTNETWGFAQTLMMYDIAALQTMYGANFNTNSGNTVYRWSPTTGEMSINGVGQGAPGGNRIFETIWDGGGSDTYDFSNYSSNLSVSLQPGAWTTTSSSQLARLYYTGSVLADGNIANALTYQGDLRSLIENALGGSGADQIVGNQLANELRGNGGNDSLNGMDGDDTLDGGAGNDTIAGGAGVDGARYHGAHTEFQILSLGNDSYQVDDLRSADPDGTDIISSIEAFIFDDGVFALAELLGTGAVGGTSSLGTSSSDVLIGTLLRDEIDGLDGADEIYGLGEADYLRGAAGNDRLYGGDGDDLLVGGSGADVFTGGAGRDEVAYHTASMAVEVDLSRDLGRGGEAEGDRFGSVENLIGTLFDDLLTGDNGDNYIYGLAGNDRLWGGSNDDILIGGAGADVLTGGAGLDSTSYHNSDSGVRIDLNLCVGRYGDAEGDLFGSIEDIIGSPFDDTIFGDNADNRLWGQEGADELQGGTGNDQLYGGAGDDRIWGENGNDLIAGDAGADMLIGGLGSDTFVYRDAGDSTNASRDQIIDFSTAHGDKIDLQLIDADLTTAGDQAFVFIGQAAFTNVAGQLRYSSNILEGDTNGDGVADFVVQVNTASLANGDFVL